MGLWILCTLKFDLEAIYRQVKKGIKPFNINPLFDASRPIYIYKALFRKVSRLYGVLFCDDTQTD